MTDVEQARCEAMTLSLSALRAACVGVTKGPYLAAIAEFHDTLSPDTCLRLLAVVEAAQKVHDLGMQGRYLPDDAHVSDARFALAAALEGVTP